MKDETEKSKRRSGEIDREGGGKEDASKYTIVAALNQLELIPCFRFD